MESDALSPTSLRSGLDIFLGTAILNMFELRLSWSDDSHCPKGPLLPLTTVKLARPVKIQ